jgi:DNA-binding transcriptional MerR regulator
MDRAIPNKLFFKIGEVCEITDTQPYVLRYWESEFPSLAPAKNSSGQRIYRRKDIETVVRIKQLLYEEGFTIAGAKKRLEAESTGKGATPRSQAATTVTPEPAPAPGPSPSDTRPAPNAQTDRGEDRTRDVLLQVQRELRELLTLLDRDGKRTN